MATMSLTAGEVMDRSAALMNDPAKTDYTYEAQLVYLNMAIDELNELLEESNIPMTNEISLPLYIPVGRNLIIDLPSDLVEIQELGERPYKSNDAFRFVPRQEFLSNPPASSTFLFWCWLNQTVKFNPNGATSPREIQLKYIRRPIRRAQDENAIVESINASTWLQYKTAALLAMFIGENETRAGVLNGQADLAFERIVGISNKGKQQIMTRHRPFRSNYKSRSY